MFGKVNPGRTEAALEGFNRKQDAVDKLFESSNHQIFLSAILYIFQIILSPSLMISVLIEPTASYKQNAVDELLERYKPQDLSLELL